MIIDVALPIPIGKSFSYSVPDRWQPFITPFLRVSVPFHNRIQTGVIVAVRDDNDPKLKEMGELTDFFPLIDDAIIGLARWSSHHYATPMGLVLKYIFPQTLNPTPHVSIKAETEGTLPLNDLSLKKACVLTGRLLLFQYCQKGLLTLYNTMTKRPFAPILSGSYGESAVGPSTLFIGDVHSRINHYLAAIEPALQKNSNVLMLLPDLYATGEYFKKVFSDRFGEKVLWYGAGVSAKSRMETFFKAREDGGYLILGNKSCVFLPICKLALAIVERPEEDEYRNEEGFKFNAALMAIMRAHMAGSPSIIGSASPSLEIYNHAEKNGFQIIEQTWLLDGTSQERFHLPDMRSSAVFLEELIPIIKDGIDKGEKIAVFLPRKHYGSYLVCHTCKKPLLCPQCEGVLDYEKEAGRVTCPVCKTSSPYEERCGHCGSNIIRFSRIGVEYIEEKLRHLFPNLAIIKITGDSLKKEIKRVRKTIGTEEPLLLVGTQSLSKLYDFPVDKLVLLGWEELRKTGGYRSDEKMVQILVNLIDALTPRSISLFMARKNKITVDRYLDMNRFYGEELQKRQEAEFPPCVRVFLIEVLRKGKDAGAATISRVKEIIKEQGVESYLSGTFMEKRTERRWQMILRGDDEALFVALSRIYGLPHVQIEADPLYI